MSRGLSDKQIRKKWEEERRASRKKERELKAYRARKEKKRRERERLWKQAEKNPVGWFTIIRWTIILAIIVAVLSWLGNIIK